MNKVLAGVVISLAIVVGVVGVGAACTFGTSNHAITLEKTTEKYKTDITNSKYAANTTLANLESAIDSSNEQYTNVINAIAAARDSEFETSADTLTTAVNLIVENYPDNPGNQELYQTYMYSVCDVVEQVKKTAEKYNDSVKDYDIYCSKFPATMFLGMAGYTKKDFTYIELKVSPTWGDKQYV